jgi:excisionase family DNA binding protein
MTKGVDMSTMADGGSQQRRKAPVGPLQRRWYTVVEVAEMLGYGPTKVRMMCISGDLRSLKDGGSRRILPAWVDEYVAKRAAEAEADWP